MSRFLKVLATFLLLALVVTACAQAETDEIFDVEYDTESGNLDFNGLELVYRSNLDSGNGVDASENYLGYTINTQFSDLAMQRVRDLESKYNFKMTVTSEGDSSKFKLLAASGSSDCDIWLGPSFNMFDWSKAGFLTGISTLSDYIDYRDADKWGSAEILESAFYGDDLYGLTPNAWPEQNYTSFGYPLVANVDLINSNAARDPRELVENQQWTWDEFHVELDANTIIEGNEAKSYGMVTSYPYYAQMIILSNGVKFAMIDDDGNIQCGYYTEAGLRAIDEVRNVWHNEYKYTIDPSETYLSEVVMRNFVDGHGSYAFLPTHFIFGVYGEVAMYLDNFAILPTPTGPDVDPGYVAGLYHTMYYTIAFPAAAQNPEASAIIVNELYEPLPGFETIDDIKDYMSHNYFFDERDADAFFNIFNNSCYNYDYTTGFESRRIPENICTTNTATSEILQSQKSVIESCFEEFVKPTLSALTTLYPERFN